MTGHEGQVSPGHAGADAAEAAGRQVLDAEAETRRAGRSLVAPADADWMPPTLVLAVQLIVAIAVGASPLVIVLMAATTLVVLVAVRRSRKIAPRRGSVAGIRYRERLIPVEHPAPVPLGESQRRFAARLAANGHGRSGTPEETSDQPAQERRSDLDWLAASIHVEPPRPGNPPVPGRRR